ncbi:hypothetical protein JOL79_32615, partial [Microbispora sp. RL4-1S]|nr:hypothetical protein [Microbispora oryzae]
MPETSASPQRPASPDVAPEAAGTARGSSRVRLARLRDFALIPAVIVIAIVGQIVNPIFLQGDNLINILQTMSEVS